MQGGKSIQQYRAIDCSLFALILIVLETVIIRAATVWFPKEAWTVSLVPAVTAIVMVRWGPWCAVHAVLGGIVTALGLKGSGLRFLVYGAGNLAVLALWPLQKKWGWEKLHQNVLVNFLYAGLTVLAMQTGRAAMALVTGTPADGLLLFITTDSITYIFTLVILWVAARLDGILEEQTHYLARISDQERAKEEYR